MIKAKHTPILMAFFVSLIMSVIMSGVVTLINLGTEDFLARWAYAWIRVWPIAFISALIATPLAKKLVGALTQSQQAPQRSQPR